MIWTEEEVRPKRRRSGQATSEGLAFVGLIHVRRVYYQRQAGSSLPVHTIRLGANSSATVHSLEMQQVHQIDSQQEKHEVEHVEKAGINDDVAVVTAEGAGLMKSRFDEMSIPKTLWVFRRIVLVTLAVYTGYMCEGFEVSKDSDLKRDIDP